MEASHSRCWAELEESFGSRCWLAAAERHFICKARIGRPERSHPWRRARWRLHAALPQSDGLQQVVELQRKAGTPNSGFETLSRYNQFCTPLCEGEVRGANPRESANSKPLCLQRLQGEFRKLVFVGASPTRGSDLRSPRFGSATQFNGDHSMHLPPV